MGGHKHRIDKLVTRPFQGAVSFNQNAAAHGGYCAVSMCKCGAVRMTNRNGEHRETSGWRGGAEEMCVEDQYINNTGSDVGDYHEAIMEAIRNGGEFNEDFADIFVLTRTPEGSAAVYVLSWA